MHVLRFRMTNTKQIIAVTHGIQEHNGHVSYNSKPKLIEEIMDEEADTHDNQEAESGKDKKTTEWETSPTKCCLKSILILLSMSGCYDFNKLNVSRQIKGSAPKYVLSYIFRLSLLLVMILAIGKCVYAFFFLDASQLILNGLYVSWLCLCTCNFLVHFKSTSVKVGNQEDAFERFDVILEEFDQQGIDWHMLKVKRHVTIWSVTGCLMASVNMLGIALQCAFRDQSRTFFTTPFPPNALSLALFFIAELVASLMWIFPWIYSIIMCNMVRQAFNSFNDYLKREFCGNACSIPKDIHRMRVLHLKLCDIVSALDADMGWYFASSCVFNLELLCITLYKMVKTSDIDGYSMFLYVFWLSSALVILGLLTTFAALVNDRAHALLDTLYYIDMKDVGIDQVTQLNLFLSKLTGTQVGFTTCGLLTITKEFILTVSMLSQKRKCAQRIT